MDHLSAAPAWMIQLAGLTATVSPCNSMPAVVIHNASDYAAFASNAALTSATTLGSVVITWPAISNEQLAVVLQNKTAVDGLIIEDCTSISTLAALNTLQTVGSGFVLDGLVALSTVTLPALSRIGSILQVTSLPNLFHLTMQNVTTIGGTLSLYNMPSTGTVQFDSLTTVNGSLIISSLRALSGTSITSGFRSLVSVQNEMRLSSVSLSGAAPRTPIVLPSLVSVGSLNMRSLYISGFSAPVLTLVGGLGQTGTFAWTSLRYLSSLSAPQLTTVHGQLNMGSIPLLSTLCGLGLQRFGYMARTLVRFDSSSFGMPSLLFFGAGEGGDGRRDSSRCLARGCPSSVVFSKARHCELGRCRGAISLNFFRVHCFFLLNVSGRR